MTFLADQLSMYTALEYKQFRGQCIEAMTLMCAAVSEDVFMSAADGIIQTLLNI